MIQDSLYKKASCYLFLDIKKKYMGTHVCIILEIKAKVINWAIKGFTQLFSYQRKHLSPLKGQLMIKHLLDLE